MKISEAVKQLHASRKKFIVPNKELPKREALEYDEQIEQLFQAAAEMDTERFNYLLDLHFSLFHHQTVFFYIIAPLMVRIGEAWEDGVISVAHEHMITHIVQQRFNQFFRIFPISPNLPKVMALSPSGEQHQLGLLLFTLFLRENGYPVIYIGPDTPLDGLEEMVAKQNFKMVCMSIASPKLLKTANEYIDALAIAKPELHFILGGQGVDCEQVEGNRWYLGSDLKVWQQWLDEQNF